MLALETLHGQRIVASPGALDALDTAAWPTSVTVLRFAPDDAFVIGAETLGVSGEHAIVADESGFVGCWLDAAQLAHVAEHIDWPLPTERPALAQGFVASVPAKLWLIGDRALLLCAAPYAGELMERLA
ncbi:MAG TPA: hypothetical protein VGM78_03925 [Ilumatobacteraceae bacterium]